MTDVSERLRAAREEAGLSLQQLSARTKINTEMLRALERGDFARLPGPFYVKAFIRVYAREVGLPADELLGELAHDPGPGPASPVRVQDIPPVSHVSGLDAPRTATWQFVPIVLIVAAAVFALNRPGTEVPGDPDARPVGTAGRVEAAGLATVPVAASRSRGEAAVEGLSLEIRPSAPVWVTATADGERVIYRLLKPGDHDVVKARDEIELRVGNAAAFEYTLNGAPGQVLGDAGQVRDVRITMANYQAFQR